MLFPMPTVVLDPPPVEIDALVERRHRLGLDRNDEVWEGVLHMNPAPHGRHHHILQQLAVMLNSPARAAGLLPAMGDFNLGVKDDYRVPDGAIHRPGPDQMYYPTVALVVEIVSPGDESWEKLPFYAAHEVDEVLLIDPATHKVDWLALADGEYRPTAASGLIDFGPDALTSQLDWPTTT
jgi:Uma2 family endonuclease